MTIKIGFRLAGAAAFLLLLIAWVALAPAGASWAGVDEAVIGRFARLAGREPQSLLFDPDRGDLLLFCFLLAGAAGGFASGYFFRGLFPPERRRSNDDPRT
jgi:hypothetical protein